MRSYQRCRVNARSRLMSFVAVAIIALTAIPAVTAAPVATETVISAQRVGRPEELLSAVTTRLVVPAHAQWETDPDAGPLTFTVETGAVGVLLDGGSARIERRANPLQVGQIGPLRPGRETVLGPGDRLVIVRGFHLVVTNDEDELASAIVMRHRQAAASTGYGGE